MPASRPGYSNRKAGPPNNQPNFILRRGWDHRTIGTEQHSNIREATRGHTAADGRQEPELGSHG
jgi:hypothetical protein